MSPPVAQFFIVSVLGDPLIYHNLRNQVGRDAVDKFCNKVLQSRTRDQLSPFFTIDNIQYAFIMQNGLYFVCTSLTDLSPSFTLEILGRICTVIKDYCGELSEESIRANFILVNEMLLEIFDFGYVQTTSIEALKPCIYSEAEVMKQMTNYEVSVRTAVLGPASVKSTDLIASSNLKARPISLPYSLNTGRDRKDKEIYIDLREKLNIVFGANGNVINSEINGCIEIKSFIQSNPEINLGLPEDLVIGSTGSRSGYDHGICLNDCNFHESVQLDRFETDRIIGMKLSEGEVTVMNYRISGIDNSCCPIRLYPFIEESADRKVMEVSMKLSCEIPATYFAINVLVRLPVPKATISVSQPSAGPNQNVEFVAADKVVLWKVTRLYGGCYSSILLKLYSNEWSKSSRKEINSASIEFEIPMFTCSRFKIRYMKIQNISGGSDINRWLRLVTHSGSYEVRL